MFQPVYMTTLDYTPAGINKSAYRFQYAKDIFNNRTRQFCAVSDPITGSKKEIEELNLEVEESDALIRALVKGKINAFTYKCAGKKYHPKDPRSEEEITVRHVTIDDYFMGAMIGDIVAIKKNLAHFKIMILIIPMEQLYS